MMKSRFAISVILSGALLPLFLGASDAPPPSPIPSNPVAEEPSKPVVVENLPEGAKEEELEDGTKQISYEVEGKDGSTIEKVVQDKPDGSSKIGATVKKPDGTEVKSSVSLPSGVTDRKVEEVDGRTKIETTLPQSPQGEKRKSESVIDGDNVRANVKDEDGNVLATMSTYEGSKESDVGFATDEETENITSDAENLGSSSSTTTTNSRSFGSNYQALKNRFITNRSFVLSERRFTSSTFSFRSSDENKIEIVPSSDATFEEYSLFDGSRYIVLKSGSATILSGGVEKDMTVDKSYRIILKSTISLKTGWNAITAPINSSIQSDIFESYATKSSSSGKPIIWVMNSSGDNYNPNMGAGNTITPGTGTWVKSDSDVTFDIDDRYPSSYFVFANKFKNTKTYGATWKFIGVSSDTRVGDILDSGVKTFWPYNGYYGVYDIGYNNGNPHGNINEDSIIRAGTAFWAK